MKSKYYFYEGEFTYEGQEVYVHVTYDMTDETLDIIELKVFSESGDLIETDSKFEDNVADNLSDYHRYEEAM